jgi:hypothetical protein
MGKEHPVSRRKTKVTPPLATLSPEDLAGMQMRRASVERARLVAKQAADDWLVTEEGLLAFQRQVVERYELPPRFDLDLATGEVRPVLE